MVCELRLLACLQSVRLGALEIDMGSVVQERHERLPTALLRSRCALCGNEIWGISLVLAMVGPDQNRMGLGAFTLNEQHE
jgi:hypothetical protein